GQTVARFDAEVNNGGVAVASTGTLNGHPFSSTDGKHLSLQLDEASLLVAGDQQITLTPSGGAALQASFAVPGTVRVPRFDVTAPVPPLQLSWSPSANAAQYQVFVSRSDGGDIHSIGSIQIVDGGTSVELTELPGGTGTLTVMVNADTMPPVSQVAPGAP